MEQNIPYKVCDEGTDFSNYDIITFSPKPVSPLRPELISTEITILLLSLILSIISPAKLEELRY